MRRGIHGYYGDQVTRSVNEFVYCAYLDIVEQFKFVTEPFKIKSTINKKAKIPDVLFYDKHRKQLVLVEIKGTQKELDDLVVDYCTNKYDGIENYVFCPILMSARVKTHYIRQIKNIIGKEKWNSMIDEYRVKGNIEKRVGFKKGLMSGENAPMYGKKHSDKTKQKIREANIGKEVSLETRIQISKTLTGNKRSSSDKKSISIGVKSLLKKQCPVCGVFAPPATYSRWGHGENCKRIKNDE